MKVCGNCHKPRGSKHQRICRSPGCKIKAVWIDATPDEERTIKEKRERSRALVQKFIDECDVC